MSDKVPQGMQHIDPASLNSLPTRIAYLRDFIGFSQADVDALHAAAPVVAPLVPTVVDIVYEKLLSFDITAKAFVPRQTGYTGVAPARLEDLSMDHPQIRFRKDFLAQYCKKLVTMDYEKESSWEYLDKVGLMHTGAVGFKHREKKPGLRVEYVHCSILMGYVEDILVNAVATHPELDLDTKTAVIRAVNKILWIQNDLFARHYITDNDSWIDMSVKTPSMFALAVGGALVVGALLGRLIGHRGRW